MMGDVNWGCSVVASQLKKAIIIIDHDNNAVEDDYCAKSTSIILILLW